MSHAQQKINSVLASMDPMGLIGAGAPADEYQLEARELVTNYDLITKEAVLTVFFWAFWEDCISEDMAEAVATRCNEGVG